MEHGEGGIVTRGSVAAACVLLAAMTLLPGCKKHPTPERWTRTFGGTEDDEGLAVTPSPDGGYVMAGYTFSFGAEEDDIYLIKTSATGNQLWTKTFGGSNGDLGQSVQSTSDKGYIIAGNRGEDIYLVKTDAEGNKVWDKTFGGGYVPEGQSVLQASDGRYVVLRETKAGP